MKRPVRDEPHHQLLRQRLRDEVAAKGITDSKVLEAIANVPRHFFMDESQEEMAYIDKAFPIGEGQTISQPYTVAYQTQLLQVSPLKRVLEIGTGSAYQAAILAEIGAQVYTIERIKTLFEQNRAFEFLKRYDIQFFYGDGYEGLPEHAPFDRILLTAAAPDVPLKLLQQLDRGGIMVLPLGEQGASQRMVRIRRDESGDLTKEIFDLFSFVPMVKGTQG